MTARLIEEHLGDAHQAIEAWRAALAARPDDLDSFLALERLLTAAARMTELVEVLEKHLEIATDPADRKLIAKRIAVLYELALKDTDRAVRAWQDVLGIDDGDVEALDALAQLYLSNSSWRELAEIFERKIQITQGVGDRRLLRLQAAHLYDEKLGESNEAVSQLRAILDDSANDREALDALDRVFAREGRHADLLEVLDLRLAGEGDARARDELAFRAARLVETELSDIEAAIARYQSILSRSPAHAESREALWAIARGNDYRLQAVAALDPIMRAAARVGRGRRAGRAALRGRGHGGGAAVGAGRDRAHRGDRAPRSGQGVRRLGARADRGGDRGGAARGAGTARRRERRLPRPGHRLRGADGGDVRRRPAALAGGAAGRAARGPAGRSVARGRVPAQGAEPAGRRGGRAGIAGSRAAQAGGVGGAGGDPVARGGGHQRSHRAGRLPGGAGRHAPALARRRRGGARRLSRRARAGGRAHARPPGAARAAGARRHARGGARDPRAAGRRARRLSRAGVAVRAPPGAARRQRRARALAAAHRRGLRRTAQRSRAGDRRARARAGRGADAGRGARRDRAHRGRGEDPARGGAPDRGGAGEGRAGRRARAGAARRASLRAIARRGGGGRAALRPRAGDRSPRTSTR